MAVPIEVSYHRFDPPDGLRDRVDRHVRELDRYEHVITSGRVVVAGAHRHGDKTVLEISVELDVPGTRVVGRRSADYPDAAGRRGVAQAVTEAFRAAQRQLRERVATLREDVKTLSHQPEYGRVGEIDRTDRNGFVEMADGLSLFFSAAVVRNADFDALAEGDTVLVTRSDEEGTYGPEASSVEPTAAPDARLR